VLNEDAGDRADKISRFDRGYFFARMPIAHVTDQYIMRELPQSLLEACKRGSRITVFVNPSSVRVVERFGSAIVYYTLRKKLVGE
jgi:hypothetical protein